MGVGKSGKGKRGGGKQRRKREKEVLELIFQAAKVSVLFPVFQGYSPAASPEELTWEGLYRILALLKEAY